MDHFFLSFSLMLWIVLATLWLVKVFKQPMIIAYILSWTIIAFLFPSFFSWSEIFSELSQVWIVFLLFIIWTELSPATIQQLWSKTVMVWILQVIWSSILWFFTGLLFGFDAMTSLYIWTATALSSTIVILKLLWDKEDLDTTYGRLAVWVSVSQDIFVMLFMSIIATFTALEWWSIWQTAWTLALKILWLWIWVYVFTKYILPPLTKKIAESQEFLLLFSIWWCFIVATLFNVLGFWMEIWALFAWMCLASSPYRFEIASRMKVLKDFFIVIYFVLLWSNLSFSWDINWFFVWTGLFLVIVCKPLITMWLLKFIWHVKKNNFLAWITEIPMSEFSFILISMWISSWVIKDPNLLSMITIIWIISIFTSWYITTYNHQLFKKLWKFQKFIPWILHRKRQDQIWSSNDIILFWYWRLWTGLFKYFEKKKYNILVVDEHPEIINQLNTKWISCLYWDVLDLEFLEDINVSWTKMIISTISDTDVSIAILWVLKEKNPKLIAIWVATHIQEAIMLYDKWMDYVIMPHYIWADHTSIMLEEFWLDVEKFLKNKSKQVEDLKKKSNELLLWEFQKNRL